MKRTAPIIYIVCLLLPVFTFAYSVSELISVNNDNWPLKMNSSQAFDVASKCEMLVFIEAFNDFNKLSESVLKQQINVPKTNMQSVNRWKEETRARLTANFNMLSDAALKEVIAVPKNSTWDNLSALDLEKQMPADFINWYKATQLFYTDYVGEQIRLAALFPRITSEILQFADHEIQGHDFTDKNFLLTFDDGPTKINGNTDKLIKVLDNLDLTAQFFVLGESLHDRLNASSQQSLMDLYGVNKVYSHGKVHKAHQNYDEWQASIDYTNGLLHEIFPTENKNELLYFRPPYGQRNQQLVDYFNLKKSKLIFWNIDSRDWSSKLNVQQVTDREIKLMLLWRKGILLFHDVHSKAQQAVPAIHAYFKNASISWMSADAF